MRHALLVLTALIATVDLAASETYLIESTLTEGGKHLGHPGLRLQAGAPATVAVGDRYSLTFLIETRGDDTALVKARIETDDVDESPSMMVRLDHAASVRIGDTTLALTVRRLE